MNEALKRSFFQSDKPAHFDPAKVKLRLAEAESVIEVAVIAKDRSMLERAAEVKVDELSALVDWWHAHVTHVGGRGKKVSADRGTVSLSQAESKTGFSNQRISRYGKKRKDPERWRRDIVDAAWRRAVLDTANTTAAKWTGDPESYTPAAYLEASREVMGAIDLDPASDATAQEVVKATLWYGVADNGLTRPWHGRVFMNPPYSYPLVAQFIDKLLAEWQDGHVLQAVLLTNNNTDTRWWQGAARLATGVCFTAGRIHFYKPDGSISQPTNGQTFFYFGAERERFRTRFSEFGIVMEIAR